MFQLKTNNNTIHLKWGTWAMKRFCELENKNWQLSSDSNVKKVFHKNINIIKIIKEMKSK